MPGHLDDAPQPQEAATTGAASDAATPSAAAQRELAPSEQPDDRAPVREFYERIVPYEWTRLDLYVLEFAVARAYLQRFLPAAPARILDSGSGPGRYAVWLAQHGYDLTLLDLAPTNITWAQQQASVLGLTYRAEVGDARDLSRFPDSSFDAALLFGPLYHLPDERDRQRALRELRRVVRPGGMVFTMMLTRAAAIYEGINRWPEGILESDGVQRLLTTGQGFNFEHNPHDFEGVYFAQASEVVPLHEACGFRTKAVVGCEAMLGGRRERLAQLAPDVQMKWIELVLQTCENPALLDASERLLYVGEVTP